MIIPLTDTRRLKSDKHGYALQEFKKPKKPTKKNPDMTAKWESYRWYIDLKQAARRGTEQVLMETSASGLDDILNALERVSQTIQEKVA
jgi:hypothetical protein